MARIRTIKPEFWRHEALSALPEATHMLAAALLNYADDEGYFNAHPGLIKSECSPLREPSVSIHDSLTHLSNIGFIRLGAGPDGRRYGRILTFEDHQHINRKTPSKISRLEIVWEDALSTHAQLTEPSRLEGNREQGTGNREGNREQGREGKGEGDAGASAPIPAPPVDEAVAMWNAMAAECALPLVQRLTDDRKRRLATRLRECGGIDGWAVAIGKVRGSPFLCGQNDRSWRADFDFVTTQSKFTKLMEGKYDGRASRAGHSGGSDLETGLAGIAQGVAEHRGSS